MNKLIAVLLAGAFTFANATPLINPEYSFWKTKGVQYDRTGNILVCPYWEHAVTYTDSSVKCGVENNKWIPLRSYVPVGRRFVGYELHTMPSKYESTAYSVINVFWK